MSKKDDSDLVDVEFEAGCDPEKKIFVLTIRSTEPIDDVEYAQCLHAFAIDVEKGIVNFDEMLKEHDKENLHS